MNTLFKEYEKELDISFQDLYLRFSDDEEQDIRRCAAVSLHEAFKIIEDEEDISKLRQCFINYILDNNRDILLQINKNLSTIITKYGNSHTMKNFKGRTAYVEQSNSDSGSNKDSTPVSKSGKGNTGSTDFSTAVESAQSNKSQTRDGSKGRKNKIQKKNTNLVIVYDDPDEDRGTKLSPIYVTAEHQSEVVYSDLL